MPTPNEPLHIKIYARNDKERDLATQILQRTHKDETCVYTGSVEGPATPDVLKELYSHGLIIDVIAPVASEPQEPQATGESSKSVSGGLAEVLNSSMGGVYMLSHSAGGAAGELLANTAAAGAEQIRAVVDGLKSKASDALRTGSYNVSRISQVAVDRLRSKGEEFVKGLSSSGGGASLLGAAWEGAAADALAPPGEDLYEVALKLPWHPQWRQELAKIGGGICSYSSPNIFRMFLSPEAKKKVELLPYVVSARPYGIEKTVTPALLETIGMGDETKQRSGKEKKDDQKLFDLVLHRGADLARIKAVIAAMAGTTIDESPTLIRFRARPEPGLIGGLAARPEVKHLSTYEPPSLFVDWARKQTGVDMLIQGGAGEDWTGEGEVIAVFDSGVDQSHEDLADQVKEAIAYELKDADGTRSGTVNDFVGHGTHVCGIIAGNGKASNGAIRGIAPGAKLLSVGMVRTDPNRPQWTQLLLPANLEKLLDIAVKRGAKIINLSWGDAGREVRWDEVRSDFSRKGTYSPLSYQLDEFIWDHPDMLVVVAAGNEGAAPNGYYEFNTICSPATAKNAITVGACGSGRPEITKTYKEYKPNKFADPVGALLMSSPEVSGALSSRGPTDNESIKPDVTACGVYILSAKAKGGFMGWDPDYPKFPGKYVYLGGTSMAAPVVSGAAAIVRQYLRTAAKVKNPSGALLKAILVASAEAGKAITVAQGARANESEVVGFPDFHQGFGRIDLTRILPHAAAPKGRKLLFDDVLSASPEALSSESGPGQKVYTVTVAAPAGGGKPEPLRIVLTWTDPPGQSVQNRLNVFVDGPDGSSHLGNSDFRYHRDTTFMNNGLDGKPFDNRNTVLQVLIPAPKAGPYTFRVIAQATPDGKHPKQGFALCVCGTLAEDKL